MAFDPDKYLSKFDPDKYLETPAVTAMQPVSDFDPDKYLQKTRVVTPEFRRIRGLADIATQIARGKRPTGIKDILPGVRAAEAGALEEPEKLVTEPVKGFARGIINIEKGIADTVEMFGDVMQLPGESKNEMFNKVVKTWKELGKKMSEAGEQASNYWSDMAETKAIQPDPETFKGDFMANPSWTRGVSIVAEAIPSLGLATGISAATGSPLMGAASLGLLETQYKEAKEAYLRQGFSEREAIEKASGVAVASSVGTTVLEYLPLNRFFKGGSGKVVKDVFLGALEEGLQETTQQLWQNMVAKIGFDRTREYTLGLVESFIGGAGSGGAIGALTSNAKNIDDITAELIEKGIKPDEINLIRTIIASQIAHKGEQIDKLIKDRLDKQILPGKPVEAPKRAVSGLEAVEKIAEMPPAEFEQQPRSKRFENLLRKKPVEPVRLEPIEIPEFKSTEDADAFGVANKDNPRVIEQLRMEASKVKEDMDVIRKKGRDITDEEMNILSKLVFKHQLFNEAVQAANGFTSKVALGKYYVEPKTEAKYISEAERLGEPLPETKTKALVRRVTEQYIPEEKRITGKQALKEVLKKEAIAARMSKRETKDIFKEMRKMKRMAIEEMHHEERTEIEKILGQKPPKTLEGLRELNRKLQTLKEQGKKKYIDSVEADRLKYGMAKSAILKSMGADITTKEGRELLTGEKRIGVKPKPTRIGRFLRAATLTPQRIFNKLDKGQQDGPVKQYFQDNVNEAEDVKLINKDKRLARMEDRLAAIGITENDLRKTRKINGVDWSVDKMLTVYTAAKNKEKILALVLGNRINVVEVEQIINQMTDKERAVGEAIIEDYQENYERIRQALLDYTNGKVDLGKVKNYTPIKRTIQGYIPHEKELEREMLTRKGLGKIFAERGFTKERVKDIPEEYQQPIRLGEFSTWLEQIDKQEHFESHGKLVKELQKMVNDKAFTNTVRVRKDLGEEYLDELKDYVNRIANPNIYKSYTTEEKTLASLRRNVSIAYLGINLMTISKQVPSIAYFLGELSPADLISGVYDLTTDYHKNVKMIHDLAPQLKYRAMTRELEELKNQELGKYKELIRRYGQKAMSGIYFMDKIVTHSGWLAAFNRNKREGLSTKDAARKATDLVLKTQPAAAPKDIPGIYARANELMKGILQFSNQINKIYNIATYDIPTDIKMGRYKKGLLGGTGIALGAYVMASLAAGKPLRDKEELSKGMFEQLINYVPIIGRGITSMTKGFGREVVSIPAFAGVEAAVQTGRRLVKGEIKEAIKPGLETTAVLAGIPYAQPKRFLEGRIIGPKKQRRTLGSKIKRLKRKR